MQVTEWRKVIGEMVREHMRSAALEHYFSVKMNKARANKVIKSPKATNGNNRTSR